MDWAVVMGVVSCFLHCMVLKCVVCYGIDCYCMVVVLEWAFSWFVVQLLQVVLVKEVFSRLAVGVCMVVLSFVLTGYTECWHWGTLIVHERMFILCLGSWAGNWICIWLWLFIIWISIWLRLFIICGCQDVGVAQLIWHVNALVCMVLLFHSLTCILCCTCCTCVGGGGASVFTAVGIYWEWLPVIWVTAGRSAACLAFEFSSGFPFYALIYWGGQLDI